jgi:hypothetical protein
LEIFSNSGAVGNLASPISPQPSPLGPLGRGSVDVRCGLPYGRVLIGQRGGSGTLSSGRGQGEGKGGARLPRCQRIEPQVAVKRFAYRSCQSC